MVATVLETYSGAQSLPSQGAALDRLNTDADNIATGVTANTFTFDTAYRYGSTGFGLKCVNGGSAASYVEYTLNAPVGSRIVVLMRKVTFADLSNTSDLRILLLRAGLSNAANLVVNSGKFLALRDAAGAFVAGSTSDAPLVIGNFYDLELAVTFGATTTSGTIAYQYYAHGSLSPIGGKTITGVNSGLSIVTNLRNGVVAVSNGTSTYYNDNIEYEYKDSGWIVGTENIPPTATVGASQFGIVAGSTVTSTVTAADADGTISTITAIGSSGITLSGTGSTRTFIAPTTATDATYSVTWTVTDNLGAKAIATQSFQVNGTSAATGTILQNFDGQPSGTAFTTTNLAASSAIATGTGNTWQFDSTFRKGASGAGAKIVNAGTATQYAEFNFSGTTSTRTNVLMECFIIPSATGVTWTSDLRILTQRAGTSNCVTLQVNPSRYVSLRDASGTYIASSISASQLALDTSYDFELAVTPGTTTTNGKAEYRIYAAGSQTPIQTVFVTGINTGLVLPDKIRWGVVSIATGGATYYNDTLSFAYKASGWMKGPANIAPTVVASANQTGIEPGQPCVSNVVATDSDGSVVSSTATADNGVVLSGSGYSRTFIAPSSNSALTVTVTWVVTDDVGATATTTQTFGVMASTRKINGMAAFTQISI